MAGMLELRQTRPPFPELDGTVPPSIRNQPSAKRLATRLRDAYSRGTLYIVQGYCYQSNYFYSKVNGRAPRGSARPMLNEEVPKGSIVLIKLNDVSHDDSVALIAQRDTASADFEPRMASEDDPPGAWRLLVSPFGMEGPDVLRACGLFRERLGYCLPSYYYLGVVTVKPASPSTSRSFPANLSRVPVIEQTQATRSNSRASNDSKHSSNEFIAGSDFRRSSLGSGASGFSLRPDSTRGPPLLHTATSSIFETPGQHSRTSSPAFSYDGRPPINAPERAGPVKNYALEFRTPSGGSYTNIGSTSSSQHDRSRASSPLVQPRLSGSSGHLSRRTSSIVSAFSQRASDSPPVSRPGSREIRASNESLGSSFGISNLFANTAQAPQAARPDSMDSHQQATRSRSVSTHSSGADVRRQSLERMSPSSRTPSLRGAASPAPSRPKSSSSADGMRSLFRRSTSSSATAAPQPVGTRPSLLDRWTNSSNGKIFENAHYSLDRRWGDPARNHRNLNQNN